MRLPITEYMFLLYSSIKNKDTVVYHKNPHTKSSQNAIFGCSKKQNVVPNVEDMLKERGLVIWCSYYLYGQNNYHENQLTNSWNWLINYPWWKRILTYIDIFCSNIGSSNMHSSGDTEIT